MISRLLIPVLLLSLVTDTSAQSKKSRVKSLPKGVSVLSDIEYAKPNGYSLKLDLYRPKNIKGKLPVVVFVHGGGWKNGSKNSARTRASWLAQHGFAVAGISYRLTDVAQWPAQIDDCYTAVRWLRQHADQYQLDADHIGAWGTSAGAHLVALMGTRTYPGKENISSRVQAACDWFGPTELLTMPPNNVGNGRTEADIARSNGAKLLGATVRDIPDIARDASALDQVSKDDAPFLIMHGDADPGVPLTQSTKFHKKLLKHGIPAQLHIIKGAGHGGPQFNTPEAKEIVRLFFEKQLKPNWSQGPGPSAGYHLKHGSAPTKWSVTRDENIKWKRTLPETGQSTVTLWGNRLFLTTMKPVEKDSPLGKDIIAWCCNAETGTVLWKREIPADYPLRMSGCFSDSSSPPPVTDGKRVCFLNASGMIACFDFDGNKLWNYAAMAVGRSQPFLLNGSVVFTKQNYMPTEKGQFGHDHKDAPLKDWTQLQAVNLKTGKVTWTSTCGINMGGIPLPHLLDGKPVILLGRGGGHSPPEKPEGVSMIDGTNGKTLWTLPLEGFMSTMTMNMHNDHALIFHGGEHLWVNARTGKIVKRVSFVKDIPSRLWKKNRYVSETLTIPAGKKMRSIIQQCNILVGDYHYFRSYTHPYVGRVHAHTGKVEFLQLPVQLMRKPDSKHDKLLWDADGVSADTVKQVGKKGIPITRWAFRPNDMKNSRGYVVMGDARSQGNGWGHHATAIPTAVGNHLYIPIMSGTVYVLNWNAPTLDEKALVAINDLGPVGQSWTRASLSFAGGQVYGHTIRELICVGE